MAVDGEKIRMEYAEAFWISECIVALPVFLCYDKCMGFKDLGKTLKKESEENNYGESVCAKWDFLSWGGSDQRDS